MCVRYWDTLLETCLCVRYWDTLLEMFYPRFEFILLQNVHSIRECEPQKLGHIDVRPHYVCFSLSLSLSLSSSSSSSSSIVWISCRMLRHQLILSRSHFASNCLFCWRWLPCSDVSVQFSVCLLEHGGYAGWSLTSQVSWESEAQAVSSWEVWSAGMWHAGRCGQLECDGMLTDNSSVCGVFCGDRRPQREFSERASEPADVTAAQWGGELCPANGGGVSSAQRTAHLPHQQLRHDACCHRGSLCPCCIAKWNPPLGAMSFTDDPQQCLLTFLT